MKNCLRFLSLLFVLIFWDEIVYAQVTNKVTLSDPTKEIVVTKDAPEFAIILASNPTTGYSWVVKKCDINFVSQVKTAFYPVGNDKLVGAPGYQQWTFKIVNPEFFLGLHKTNITLTYKRLWEKQGIKTLEFKVISNNAN